MIKSTPKHLARLMHALLALGSPVNIEELIDWATRDDLDFRDVLDELDAMQPIYVYGPMIGLA